MSADLFDAQRRFLVSRTPKVVEGARLGGRLDVGFIRVARQLRFEVDVFPEGCHRRKPKVWQRQRYGFDHLYDSASQILILRSQSEQHAPVLYCASIQDLRELLDAPQVKRPTVPQGRRAGQVGVAHGCSCAPVKAGEVKW
jgi:hypothetical protein